MSVEYTNGQDTTIKTYVFQEYTMVNRGNVELYIQYMTQFYLQDSIKQAASFVDIGMKDVLGKIDLSFFDGVLF